MIECKDKEVVVGYSAEKENGHILVGRPEKRKLGIFGWDGESIIQANAEI